MSGLSVFSVLISLIMAITGSVGGLQPEAATRTLTISDFIVMHDDDVVNLDPALVLTAGASDSQGLLRAALRLGDEELFPVQLGVSEDKLALLVEKPEAAVAITSGALEGLYNGFMESGMVSMGDPATQEVLSFLVNEFVPAYMGLMEMTRDPEALAELKAQTQGLVEDLIDKGEGVADTVELEGTSYDVLRYEYTVDAAQMGAVADAVFAANDTLKAYSDALFKLYSYMPEESGLNGLTSFSDVMTGMGMGVTLDAVEWTNEAGDVQVFDAAITMDVSGMIAKAAQTAQTVGAEGDVEIPTVEPLVMTINGSTLNGLTKAEVKYDWSIEDARMVFTEDVTQNAESASLTMMLSVLSTEGETDETIMSLAIGGEASMVEPEYDVDIRMNINDGDTQVSLSGNATKSTESDSIDLQMDVTEDDEQLASFDLTKEVFPADDEGIVRNLNCGFEAPGQASGNAVFSGLFKDDGTSSSVLSVSWNTGDGDWSIGCQLNVDAEPVENAALASDAYLLDNFSEETLGQLMQDEAFTAKLGAASASLTADAQTLMGNESVQALMAMFTGVYAGEDDGYDYSYDNFDDDDEYDGGYDDEEGYTYEEPTDDGVLSYEEPQLGWLPEGWTVSNKNIDTAYDFVDLDLSDAEGNYVGYVMFMESSPEDGDTYVLDEEGNFTQVVGQQVNVDCYDESTWSASMNNGSVYTYITLMGENVDIQTLGQMLAGIQY